MMEPTSSALFIEPAERPERLSPLVLAYIGDTLYDLFVRQYLVSQPNHRLAHLHQEASKYVSAKAQSSALQMIMPMLNDEEKSIVKRGRNAKSNTIAKNADVLEYRHSTAFECLLGYLYYNRQFDRLKEIMQVTLAN